MNILIVTNRSWILDHGNNLLGTISLVKQVVKVFLKKAEQSLEIVINKEVFEIANIIKILYIIWLVKNPKLITINQVIAPIIKIWHAQMGHLGYKSLLELLKLVYGIKIKKLAFTKIYSRYIRELLQ